MVVSREKSYSRLLLPDKDSYVNSGHPKKNYGHRKSLRVGIEDSHSFLSLLRLKIKDLRKEEIIIDKATLSLYLAENHAPGVEKIVEVKRCLSNWKEKKVTYEHYPIVAQQVEAYQVITGEKKTYISFDITELTGKWYSGEYENLGIVLSSEPKGLMKFSSRETANSLYHPQLLVEYTLPPVTAVFNPFFETSFKNLITTDDFQSTAWLVTKDTAAFSFMVVNQGSNPAQIKLEISPDAVNTYPDTQHTLAANRSEMFIPNYFLKYSRISYASLLPGQPTTLDIFFQCK